MFVKYNKTLNRYDIDSKFAEKFVNQSPSQVHWNVTIQGIKLKFHRDKAGYFFKCNSNSHKVMSLILSRVIHAELTGFPLLEMDIGYNSELI